MTTFKQHLSSKLGEPLVALSEPGAVATGSYLQWLMCIRKRVSRALRDIEFDKVATAAGSLVGDGIAFLSISNVK